MILRQRIYYMIPVYVLILACTILIAIGASKGADAFNETVNNAGRQVIIIDAGHGYPDGGATSCSGKLESEINLEIALRLNDLLQLLGVDTVMTRTGAESVYTQGETIAAKKISDLKNRVSLVNSIPNAIVISIHQNYFQDGKYRGAQMFYNTEQGSKELATVLQEAFINTLNQGSKRRPKRGEGVYLLNNARCTAVLVECGFLSNFEEDKLLQDKKYQRKICSVLASCLSTYINDSI